MVEEIWKPIEGYEGLYEVSNLGRVKSFAIPAMKQGKILKPNKKSNGYMRIILCKNGVHKFVYIHRLVAEAFVPNPENKPCVNHIDNERANNHADNLEWCTQKENVRHAAKQGRLCKENGIKAGIKTRKAVVATNGVHTIHFKSMRDAERSGFNMRSVWRCCNRKRKTHMGYSWRYSNE